MIRKMTGTVVDKSDQAVVLEVRDIGYLISVPTSANLTSGSDLTLHTYLAVRENALDLYGFETADELELFEHLLTLPKIGPKSALQILSQANIKLIKTAVANNDPAQLSKMSGIGKKTAEKVVAGLMEIYKKEGYVITPDTAGEAMVSSELGDTIEALITLGYSEVVARKTVQSVVENKPELSDTNKLLKEALKLLS